MLFTYYIIMAALSLFSVVQFQEILPDDGHGYTIGSGYSPHTFFRRITHMARRHTIVRRRSASGPVLVLPIFLPSYPAYVPFRLGNGTGDYVHHSWFSPPHSTAAPRPTQLPDDLLLEGVMPSNVSLSKTGSPLESDFANLSTFVDDHPIIWGPINAPWAIEPITPFVRDEPVSPPVSTAPHIPSHTDQTVPPPDASSGLDCPDCPEGWTLVETVHHRIFRRTKDMDSHVVATPSIRYEDTYIDDSPFKKATQLWFSNNYNSIAHFLTSEWTHALVTLYLKIAAFVAALCAVSVLVSAAYSSLVQLLDDKTKSNLDPFDLIFRQDGPLFVSKASQTDSTRDVLNILGENFDQVEQPAAASTSTWSLLPPSPVNLPYPPLPSPFPQAAQEEPQEELQEEALTVPVDGTGRIDSGEPSSTQSKSDRLSCPLPKRALKNQPRDDSQNGPGEEPLEETQEKSDVRASKFNFNFDFSSLVPTTPSNSEDISVGTETKVIAPDTVLQNGSSADTPESTASTAGTGSAPAEEGQHLHEKKSITFPSSTKATDSVGQGDPDADSADSASTVTATQAAEVVDGPSPPTADPNDAQTWTTASGKKKNKNKKGKNKAQKPPAQAEPVPQ